MSYPPRQMAAKKPIIAIDGPAGAGKTTIARMVGSRLGLLYIDTGAMYRAVALAALRRGHDWNEPEKLVELAREIDLDVGEDHVAIGGQDVTGEIRTKEVTAVTHYAANNPGVRAILVELQRRAAGNDDLVSEGRDQGTIVFPHAECKFYLIASPEERARRRAHELAARGQPTSVEEVLRDQTQRDRSDATRSVGPMIAASDAVEVDTDGLNPEQVLDRLEALVREKMTS